MKFLYVVGARPNFVKTAPVLAAMRRRFADADHALIHTGQHYDSEMSESFIEDLDMPKPDYRLAIGSGTHAAQTARALEGVDQVLTQLRPDLAFVSGDVNSTLGGALAFAKRGVPYAHIESGLRSFDRSMPEEINRIVADEFAEVLFTHSDEAGENLAAEGIESARVHMVGNTMIDSLIAFEERFRSLRTCRRFGFQVGGYLLVTLHRPALVDGPALDVVLAHLEMLAADLPVLFPVHPRTRTRLDETRYPRIRFTRPLGYLEFLSAEADARRRPHRFRRSAGRNNVPRNPVFHTTKNDGASGHDPDAALTPFLDLIPTAFPTFPSCSPLRPPTASRRRSGTGPHPSAPWTW